MRIATTLFASCALLVPFTAASDLVPCKADKDGICQVTVIVPAGCGSGIHAAPDPIVQRGGGKIAWTIRSSGDWKFAEKGGIRFHDGGKVFMDPSRTDDTTFRITNPGKSGVFKYDITLTRKVGDKSETCTHDPTVVNQ